MVARTDVSNSKKPNLSLQSGTMWHYSGLWKCSALWSGLICMLLLSGCTSTTQSEWSCPLPDSENCLDVEHSDKLALQHLKARNQQADAKASDTAVVSILRQPEPASLSEDAENTEIAENAESTENISAPISAQADDATQKITVGGLFSAVIGGVALSVNSIGDGLSSDTSLDEDNASPPSETDTGVLSFLSAGGDDDISAVIARENAILDAETTPSFVSEEQADQQEGEDDLPLSSTPTPPSPQNAEEILGSETLSQALSGSSRNRLDIAPAIAEISNVDDSETDAQDGAAEQILVEQLPQIGASARMVRIPEELGEVWIGPFEANGFYYAGSYVYIQTRPPRWQVR